MKFAAAKKRFMSASAIVLVIAFALSPAVHADTFPYLKAFGGDVWAGGAFLSGGSCTLANGYQDPTYGSGSPANDRGGILTYANSGGGGSTGEFGALALGLIDNGGTNGGFYSDAHSNSASKKLSFANTGAGGGGLFEGSTPQGHCIPDYYGKLRSGASAWTGDYNATGQFEAGNTTLSGGTINGGTNLTLFVAGDAYIANNITYQSGYNADNVPKFALVVKGNIFIGPGVTQLDGVYIAQPTSGTTNGNIWTCYDVATPSNSSYGPWIHDNCNNKLTVNGSLIAKQVNYLRIPGDISDPTTVAETVNYTPAMVIGGPFFNPPPSTTLPIDSLVSLPPLF